MFDLLVILGFGASLAAAAFDAEIAAWARRRQRRELDCWAILRAEL